MRLHIEGKHTRLAPHLMGWIADRLAELNTPDEDIFEARITFVQQKRQEVARVQLQTAGKLLQITQRALQEVRATRRVRAAMPIAKGEALRTYATSAARQA